MKPRTLTSTPLDVTFIKESRLDIRVPMDGPLHVFSTGRRGHTGRDYFDWKGKHWLLQFRAFVEESRSETTHGLLVEKTDNSKERASGDAKTDVFARIRDKLNAERDRREAGWSLGKVSDGVHAIFDLSRLRILPSGKVGSFASFNINIDGVSYRAQFNLAEQVEPARKPTEWDRSKGAKAGLPTLGKRR